MKAGKGEEFRSRMFPDLDRYQKEECWAVMKIAQQRDPQVRGKGRQSRAGPIFND